MVSKYGVAGTGRNQRPANQTKPSREKNKATGSRSNHRTSCQIKQSLVNNKLQVL